MALRVAAPDENELPDAYGRSRVALLPVDPYHVHAYWEVTPEDCLWAAEQLGEALETPRWVLRFYDVTFVTAFDVFVEVGARNWYVDLWSAEKSYFVELGLLAGDGFVAVCRSIPAETPRAGPSPSYDPKWATVSASPDAPVQAQPARDPELPPAAPELRVEAPREPQRDAPAQPPLRGVANAAPHRASSAARAEAPPSRSTSLVGSSSSGRPAG
jgi:Domain of unknown function (DUF4912)